MVTQGYYTVLENRRIARNTYRIRLGGSTLALARPGQFVNIRLDGLYLRRPMSVSQYAGIEMTLIYKVIGRGTQALSQKGVGETLDLLVGLGNGFDITPALGHRIALVAGGCGLPPMAGLMERLAGEDVTCVMGFQSATDVFYAEEMAALGARVRVATVDGTRGEKGLVTDILKTIPYTYYFACGPQPMLEAVHALGQRGQLSFEERMGCGFGACMGCPCETLTGPKRICADGPVFYSEEVRF